MGSTLNCAQHSGLCTHMVGVFQHQHCRTYLQSLPYPRHIIAEPQNTPPMRVTLGKNGSIDWRRGNRLPSSPNIQCTFRCHNTHADSLNSLAHRLPAAQQNRDGANHGCVLFSLMHQSTELVIGVRVQQHSPAARGGDGGGGGCCGSPTRGAGRIVNGRGGGGCATRCDACTACESTRAVSSEDNMRQMARNDSLPAVACQMHRTPNVWQSGCDNGTEVQQEKVPPSHKSGRTRVMLSVVLDSRPELSLTLNLLPRRDETRSIIAPHGWARQGRQTPAEATQRRCRGRAVRRARANVRQATAGLPRPGGMPKAVG